MKRTAPETPRPGQMIFQGIICCPRCASPLARETIDMKADPDTGIWTVKAHCDHCHILAIATSKLTGGVLHPDGPAEILTDPCDPRYKSFLKKLAFVRGDRTLNPEPRTLNPVPASAA